MLTQRALSKLHNPSTYLRPLLSIEQHHSTPQHHQRRRLHHHVESPPPPKPTPFVPDVSTFLTLIGRQLSQHASKIPDWPALFNLTSPQLKDLGVEPAEKRRYLLYWRQRFRERGWGIGGDLQHVEDGVGEVKLVDVPVAPAGADNGKETVDKAKAPTATMTRSPNTRKLILNLPRETSDAIFPAVGVSDPAVLEEVSRQVAAGEVKPVAGMQLLGGNVLRGSNVEIVKGSGGRVGQIKVKEGLWELRKGHKVDGGERRKAMVRAIRRAAENRAAA